MRFFVLGLLIFTLLANQSFAQHDSSSAKNNDSALLYNGYHKQIPLLDSVAIATAAKEQFIADSIATLYIKPGDPMRRNLLTDTLLKMYLYKGHGFWDMPPTSKSYLKEGKSRQTRDQWIIVIIIGLLIYTAVLHRLMHKDFESVWLSFYNKRMLTQVSKEDNLISFWTFVGLFLLFGLTFGLFLYQLASYYHVFYSIGGLQLFASLSFTIITLFAAKFLLLKFIGFVFNINKLVSEYLSVLYLTYFNIAFVFLPVVVCFSLVSASIIPLILLLALTLIVIIFIWQYIRSSVNIISNILFHKFYLFIYLCALEICPILILIKALNI
jgi:hypothetical protein